MQEANIIFEQPLNEYIRICLRVEHLLNQAETALTGESPAASRTALEAMLEILNVIDRPDLKSKIVKALSQYAEVLSQLTQKEQVDHQKLQSILQELDQLISNLHRLPDKIAYPLRLNSFLNTIRQHMANPAGACPFSTPAYYLWLHQPATTRIAHLQEWFSALEQLQAAVRLLLRLTRNSTSTETIVAPQGFYHRALDPKLSYHLIRVSVPTSLKIYPEISVGRHRLIVRFLTLNVHDRGIQKTDTIEFGLTCCLPLTSFA